MAVEVDRPRAQGYGVALGDDWFRLAATPDEPLNIYTRDSLAPRSDDRSNPDENVLDIGHAFSRSDLTGGEGLDFWPRPPGRPGSERDVIRFWDSANLAFTSPSAGEPHGIHLSEATAVFTTPATAPTDAGASSSSWYLLVGQDVLRFADWNNDTPEDTDDIGVDLVSISVAMDNSVAVLDAAGDIWFKSSKANGYVKVYDHTTDGPALEAQACWLVKGRIIAYCSDPTSAADGVMLEIAPVIGGTPATPTAGASVYTTIDTFTGAINDVVDAGHAIVAAFSDGSLRSYVPETDAAGDVPILTIKARMPVPFGENPFALGWNAGALLVLTADTAGSDHVRLYTGSVLDVRFDYAVGQLQLLRTWDASAQSVPDYTYAMVPTRDEMFFWIEEEPDTFHLWRHDLVTQGLFRHLAEGRTAPTAMFTYDDRLGFIDGDDMATTIEDVYATSGYVITPMINFNLNTPLNWLAWVVEGSGLDQPGTMIELYRSSDIEALNDPDHPSWVLVERLTDNAQSGQERTTINVVANAMTLQLRLYAGTANSTTPHGERFAVRAYPTHRDWIADIPVSVSDMVEVPGRMPLHVPGHGNREYERLLRKVGTSTSCLLLEPPTHIWGMVVDVAVPVPYMTERGSQGRSAMMRVRGNRILADSGTNPVGNAGYAVGSYGIASYGIGQETE